VDNRLDSLVAEISAAAIAAGIKVVTAESCTGGWISKCLTDRAGSSAWFEYGFVTYGNNAKADLLGVPAAILDSQGAVSPETAEAMVQGALARSGADIGVAVTGIAGPDGGQADKPVGTVWMAWAVKGQTPTVQFYQFSGDRNAVREQTVIVALSGLLERIKE
jgi:nicotinamide-nucleotide amidase